MGTYRFYFKVDHAYLSNLKVIGLSRVRYERIIYRSHININTLFHVFVLLASSLLDK
jgi:hypothetical protein